MFKEVIYDCSTKKLEENELTQEEIEQLSTLAIEPTIAPSIEDYLIDLDYRLSMIELGL